LRLAGFGADGVEKWIRLQRIRSLRAAGKTRTSFSKCDWTELLSAYSDTAAEKTLAVAPLSALVLEALNPRLLGLEDDVDLSLLEAELSGALEGVRQTMSQITAKR
jgi:hypothetical protein